MTCIVAVKEGDHVVIGGDACASNGYNQQARADTKVFRNGEYVIGFTTSFRMGQVLRYVANLPPPDTWDVNRFMSTTFVTEVRRAMKESGWMGSLNGHDDVGQFIVAWRDRIFVIDSDLQVGVPVEPYAACGAGMMVALGVCFARFNRVTDGTPAESVIKRALEAASHHTAGVLPPWTLVSTEPDAIIKLPDNGRGDCA